MLLLFLRLVFLQTHRDIGHIVLRTQGAYDTKFLKSIFPIPQCFSKNKKKKCMKKNKLVYK